jgi:hypothetical protein
VLKLRASVLSEPKPCLNVDVAPNSIGVGTDFVGRLGQLFCFFLVDSGDDYRERGGQNESARVIATGTDFSSDFDVWIRKSDSGLAAHA